MAQQVIGHCDSCGLDDRPLFCRPQSGGDMFFCYITACQTCLEAAGYSASNPFIDLNDE
jgi:hypothetical protein